MGKKVYIADKVANHINTGGKTVGTTAVVLSANDRNLAGGVQIVAAGDNTGVVYVGVRPTLTAGSADATDGFPLAASESLLIPVQQESKVYLIADAASQGIHFISF